MACAGTTGETTLCRRPRRLATLPRLNGLELQSLIAGDWIDMPIIFITGHADVPMTVKAMKAGAVEFSTKPVPEDVLINAIDSAIARSRITLDQESKSQALLRLYAKLTPRERDVVALVVRGLLNKRGGTGHGRDNSESPPRPSDAQDERGFFRRPC
jgi:DNA-binding NarL/FixJ family response regulator